MKRIQTIFLVALLTLTFNAKPAHAIFGVGDVVFDPAAFGQFIIAQGSRLKQVVEETSSAISSGTSAVQQTLQTLNSTVFRPMQDAMMLMSMLKSSDQIKSLILGSTSGQVSLLIQNPERYLKQEGVKAIKLNVNYVDKANGVYSNSILDSVVSQARVRSDTQGQLTALSQSSIPKKIQDDLCEDSKLTATAINDVSASDGTYDQTEMQNRKKELWNKLCVGDPYKDQTLAKTLTTAGKTTGAGGWGTFLAKTGGENNFTKTNQALDVIESDRLAKEAAQSADLARGEGIVSKTECVNKVKNAATGGEDCAEKVITNAGKQLSESFSKAINAQFDTLRNSYGTGGTFASILGSVASIVGSVNAISNSVNSLQGAANGLTSTVNGITGDQTLQINLTGRNGQGTSNTGGTRPTGGATTGGGTTVNTGNNGGVVTQPGNTNTTTNTTSSYTQDLAGDTNKKNQLIKPIKAQLNTHIKSLQSLEIADKDMLAAIEEWQGHLNSINSCYQQLIAMFPQETLEEVTYPGQFSAITFQSIANDARVVDALNYYSTKKNDSVALKDDISNELSLVGQTRTLVNSTITSIDNSNSTEEIVNIYDSYNSTVDNNNLPSAMSGMGRGPEVLQYKTNTANEIRDYTGQNGAEEYNGKITILKNQCAAIKGDEQNRRNAARQARNNALNDYSNYGGGY